MKRRFILRSLLFCAPWVTALFADSVPVQTLSEQPPVPKPMETTGLEPDIATILEGYFEIQLGGEAVWEALESIRYEGTLYTPSISGKVVVFKKKPDYVKVTLDLGNGIRSIAAYDGEDAWKFFSAGSEPRPQNMLAAERGNFIREGLIGSHLLYPLMEGKTFTLDGSEIVEEVRCYRLIVTLPDGEKITYFMDFNGFSIRGKLTTNRVTGEPERTFYSDFKKVAGVTFPFTVRRESNGELVNRVEIRELVSNPGSMPWMFKRESVNLAPEAPEGVRAIPEPEDPGPDPFGGSGSFESIEAKPIPSVMDAITEPLERKTNPFAR